MENRREKILGTKKLLAGVLIATLLITLLPFENMGTLVVKGADASTATGLDVFDECGMSSKEMIVVNEQTTEDGMVLSAEEVFVNYLYGYSEDAYPNGMILELACDLDLSADVIESLPLFIGKIGIYLNGYSITGIAPERIMVNEPEVIPTTSPNSLISAPPLLP